MPGAASHCVLPTSFAVVVFGAVLLTSAARGQAHEAVVLSTAIVADGERAARLDSVLQEAGMRRRRVATKDCVPEALRLVDVVVIDWLDVPADAQPLGPLERWDRPTVFVGGCGDRFARRWGLPAANELRGLTDAVRTPEIEVLSGSLVRQGNLFHLTADAEPASLVAAVRLASRFAMDRAILRHATAGDAPLPAAELARRERIDAAAKVLGTDATTRDGLLALPELLGGEHRGDVETLLVDVVADGPGAGTTKNNWKSWLQPRAQFLVWDELSRVWRLDVLARARGVPSRDLRGALRGVPASTDAVAIELATKVARKYGGRALVDLATFTCWQGAVHCSWDRRAGVFRAENHHVLPAGARATSWSVAVYDPLADVDVISGGGPPPKPRVSAGGEFRELVANAFLPALLLDPSTSVARCAEEDEGPLQAIDVQIGMRGMLTAKFRLWIEADGTIAKRADLTMDRKLRWKLDGTTTCGPLTLPSKWVQIESRRSESWAIDDAAWNPELPRGLTTATEKLTKPRENGESPR